MSNRPIKHTDDERAVLGLDSDEVKNCSASNANVGFEIDSPVTVDSAKDTEDTVVAADDTETVYDIELETEADDDEADNARFEVEISSKSKKSTRIVKWAALIVVAAGTATIGGFMMMRNGVEKTPAPDPDQTIVSDVADAVVADNSRLESFGQVSDYGYEQAIFASTNSGY